MGKRRKGYFKAHKITELTAQEEYWLLPKLCRFVQMLCKLAMQRWQGALADRLARESSHQSVSLRFGSRGAVTSAREGVGGTGSDLFETMAYLSLLGVPPTSDPPTHLPYLISSQRWLLTARTLW